MIYTTPDIMKNLPITKGKKIVCAYCGRDKFTRPEPHNCNGNYRKYKLRWILQESPIPTTTPD